MPMIFTIFKRHRFLISYFHLKFGPVNNRDFENVEKESTGLRCRKVRKSALLLQHDHCPAIAAPFWQCVSVIPARKLLKIVKSDGFCVPRDTIARFCHKNAVQYRAILVAAKYSVVTIQRFEVLKSWFFPRGRFKTRFLQKKIAFAAVYDF